MTSGEYVDVELAGRSPDQSHFFIDWTSTGSFVSIFSVLVLFVVVQLVAAARAPPFVSIRDDYFAPNVSSRNTTLEIDITLSRFASQRLVDVNCSVQRKRGSVATLAGLFATRGNFFRGRQSPMRLSRGFTATFRGDSDRSEFFPILRQPIAAFDAVSLRVSVTSDFDVIDGLVFRWSFVDPATPMYVTSVRCLMSAFAAFVLVLFVVRLRFDAEAFTQVACIALGVAAVVAGPLALQPYVRVFRLFCLLQLELSVRRALVPGIWAACVALGGAAFQPVYSLAAAAWVVAGLRGLMSRRFVLFAGLVVGDVAGSWLARRMETSVLQIMLEAALPMTGGAFAVFLLHTTPEKEYQQIDEGEGLGQGLAVEEISSKAEDGFVGEEESGA
jgi:hypothetical protein